MPRLTSHWLVFALLTLALVVRTAPPLLRAAPAAIAAHAAAHILIGDHEPGVPRTEPCTHKSPPGARRGAAVDDDDGAGAAPGFGLVPHGAAALAARLVAVTVASDPAGDRPGDFVRLSAASPRGPPARA